MEAVRPLWPRTGLLAHDSVRLYRITLRIHWVIARPGGTRFAPIKSAA